MSWYERLPGAGRGGPRHRSTRICVGHLVRYLVEHRSERAFCRRCRETTPVSVKGVGVGMSGSTACKNPRPLADRLLLVLLRLLKERKTGRQDTSRNRSAGLRPRSMFGFRQFAQFPATERCPGPNNSVRLIFENRGWPAALRRSAAQAACCVIFVGHPRTDGQDQRP